MDPLDHLRAGADGFQCAVCDGPVPAGSVQLLAHREALAFVQLECAACSSTTLAFVLDGETHDAPPPAPVVTGDDILDMHLFLRDWRGDVAALLAPDAPPPDRR
jgi:hypothetical protein